jgi:aminoglycoside phosphotransferase (APT) family kinase protein
MGREQFDKSIDKNVVKGVLQRAFDFDLEIFEERLEQIYQRNEENPGRGVIVHGDSHPGNFFATDEGRITFIDTPTLDGSTRSDFVTGNAPVARDYSNFHVRAMDMRGRSGVRNEEYETLMESFREAYSQENNRGVPEQHQQDLLVLRSALGTILRSGAALEEKHKDENKEELKSESSEKDNQGHIQMVQDSIELIMPILTRKT